MKYLSEQFEKPEEHDTDADLLRLVEETTDFLETQKSLLIEQFRKRLVLWAIRWSVGFVLIFLTTSLTGGYFWLWTVGIVTCAMSMLILVGIFGASIANLKRASRKVANLQTFGDEENEL